MEMIENSMEALMKEELNLSLNLGKFSLKRL